MGSEDTVIDNENVILLDQLKEILPDTNRASIAVGYFFISGFSAIMDSLHKIESSNDPNHIIRLLISPTTNRATAEALLASNESYDTARIKSKEVGLEKKGKETTQEEVKKTLEHMSQTNEDQNAVTKLVELIKKKKAQIKVYTKDQLHAKAYIFELDNRQLSKMAIVGSSNLSISGIKEHTELNLRTNHPGDSEKLLEWFDRHWNDPSCQEFTQEIADIIDESWVAKHSPNDVYDKAVLYEHKEMFDDTGDDDIQTGEELFDFQKTAVSNAIKKLDKYGGVMIADVVGTGKSYIGSAILKHLKENNRSKPLIICPPHLKEMWQDYMRDFEVYCEIESRYKIGMEDNILKRYTNCDVVLIDESHNFRNSNTNAYKALLAFMEEKTEEARIIMLSATPISNSITDLKNQLRLFPREMLLQIPPLNNTTLDEYFKGLEGSKSDIRTEADTKIRELLKYILIRRTRKQIMEKYAKKDGKRYYLEKDGGRKYFPKRKLNNPREYDVDKVYNNSFDMIQSAIENLTLARYAPGNYIKEEYLNESNPDYKKYADLNNTTKPLVGIVRTSLLKRMESSIMAFSSSVEHYQEGYKEFRKQLDNNKVPIGPDFHDEIYKKIAYDGEDYDDDDYEKRMAKIPSQYDIKAFDVERWKKDMATDINNFASIKGNLVAQSEYTKFDDKLHTLVNLINGMDQKKILIFSESAVTAKYIYKYMKKELKPARRIEQIDSKQGNTEKNALVRRFDPKNNNATDIPKSKEIDVLISTDVLSEGVNLQAGKTVINYDFHWNPVRLIQRVGRIDRIGTEHETIDVINFLPTNKIDESLSLKERVANKIDTIRRIIGHDQQILESTEALDSNGVEDIYTGNENVLDSDIVSMIDMTESKSEQDADKIKKDETKLQHVERMSFGIRSVSGKGKLLIACEAEEAIVDQQDYKISERTFRRHYEITQDGISQIGPSSFLNQLEKNQRSVSGNEDSTYNEFVADVWNKFNRDMKNSRAKKTMLKHQQYFDKKLKQISETQDVGRRAMSLLPFVGQRMLTNRQPYKKLIELRKEIDINPNMDEKIMIESLEKIRSKYGHMEYEKTINKPRILYSMMVAK